LTTDTPAIIAARFFVPFAAAVPADGTKSRTPAQEERRERPPTPATADGTKSRTPAQEERRERPPTPATADGTKSRTPAQEERRERPPTPATAATAAEKVRASHRTGGDR